MRGTPLIEAASTQQPIGLFVDGWERASLEADDVRRDEEPEQETLNRLAAMQAAAEILNDNEHLSPCERRLFLLVIRTETTDAPASDDRPMTA